MIWPSGARRVVLTGPTGHLGPNIAHALVERGDAVRLLVHDHPSDALPRAAECVRGDVQDGESLRSAFQGAEVVIHAAARISITGSQGGKVEAVNVAGARNAARAAREVGVRRFVHISSVHAFRMGAGETVDEGRPRVGPGEGAAYDRSKADGEAAVREEFAQGLDGVILHPSGVIGPRDERPSRMGAFFLELFIGTLPALTGGGFDWVDVRDVTASILAATDRGNPGESYILSGTYAPVVELGALAEDVSGVRAPRFQSPLWLAAVGAPFSELWSGIVGGEPKFTAEAIATLRHGPRFDASKAARDLGHHARPLRETVADLHRHFAETGRLARARA